MDVLKGLARGLTADYLGSPVDFATMLTNLGLAGGGYVGHKLGLLDTPPDLIDPKTVPFSSDWLAKNTPLEDTGSAAYTAGRFTGNFAPALPKIAAHMASQPHGQLNAIVWHGSPHKFDKFDSSRIGTGEGAQAYGHGLYVAESPDVANAYAGMRPAAGQSILKGKPWQANTYAEMIGEARARGAGSYEKGIASLEKDLQKAIDARSLTEAENFSNAIDALRSMQANGVELNTGQNLYKIDLPDDAIARMLDWDKPLSQQPEAVQKALLNHPRLQDIAGYREGAQWASEADEALGPWQVKGNWTGADLYKELEREVPQMLGQGITKSRGMSDLMREAGIPGIRYLDGMSRSAGEGSRNFVIFPGNEHLLTILERNGQPLPLQTGLGTPR